MPSRTGSAALYIALRGFLEAGSRLPLAVTRGLGSALGTTAMAVMAGSRRRIRANLETAFPELDPAGRDRILKGAARHFGLMLAEVSWLWRARPEQIADRCGIAGFEHFERALESGRGVVLATAHCGNWELLNARLLVEGLPLTIAVRRLDDSRVDALVTGLRSRFGTEVIPRGRNAGRKLARALAENRAVGLLIDQDIRDVPGVFVPFFGRPAWTPSGAALLALRIGCPVVPGFIHRRADGRHQVQIHPPLPPPDNATLNDQVEELTAAATAAIEAQIRAHPEQWVWMHRRWRTRPPDHPTDR
jgi:KDO2-lipid IV(A) lauroyltransferase